MTLVPLEEVAAVMGSEEMATARLPGRVKPRPDWKGRPAVSEEVAAKMLADYESEMAAEQERRHSYELYMRDRAQRRHVAGDNARRKAVHEAHQKELAQMREGFAGLAGDLPTPGPSARAHGRAAQVQALTEFDEAEPLVEYSEFER